MDESLFEISPRTREKLEEINGYKIKSYEFGDLLEEKLIVLDAFGSKALYNIKLISNISANILAEQLEKTKLNDPYEPKIRMLESVTHLKTNIDNLKRSEADSLKRTQKISRMIQNYISKFVDDTDILVELSQLDAYLGLKN